MRRLFVRGVDITCTSARLYRWSTRCYSSSSNQDDSSPLEKINDSFYGTRILVEAATSATAIRRHPQALQPYISTSISRSASLNQVKEYRPASGGEISIVFLGTGAGGFPNTYRSASSLCLRINGARILVDCGEGTQRQLALSSCLEGGYSDIQNIFITHLHADHVGGLVGLILQINDAARNRADDAKKRAKPPPPLHSLNIYGPPGLFQYICTNLTLTRSWIHQMNITVHELIGGVQDSSGEKIKKGFMNPISEWKHRHVSRKVILKQEQSATWILQLPPPDMTREQVMGDRIRSRLRSFAIVSMHAVELDHVRGVQTFGYVFEEPKHFPKILPEKAIALGINPGKKCRLLKYGFPVQNDLGTWIHPHQVLDETSVKKPRKIVVLGDHYQVPKDMIDLGQHAHVLVTESTLIQNNMNLMEIKKRGHATPKMAGELAKNMNVQVLLLNHISNSCTSEEEISKLVQSAQKSNRNASHIMVAHDFLELAVPRDGFN